MWKRNQSMMAEMAKLDFINKVIFINPDVSIRGVFSHKSKNLMSSSSIINRLIPVKKKPKLWTYTPLHLFPFKYRFKLLEKFDTQIILAIINRLNATKPYILFMNCPNIFSQYLLDKLLINAKLSIFDFSDDFIELVNTKKEKRKFSNNITKYAQAADIMLTINNHLKNKYAFLNSNKFVIRNATNLSNFRRNKFNPISTLEKIKSIKMPIIGYSGIINASRIDFSLLDYLLHKRPKWQFVFIGSADSSFAERYFQYQNVWHFPPVDYQNFPDYLNYFNVAIIPFKINEHTKGNNLLKFHDYLAMGKPVVSTDIAGAKHLKQVIRIAHSKNDFLQGIEESIIAQEDVDVAKRKKIALMNDWPLRIKKLEEIIITWLRE